MYDDESEVLIITGIPLYILRDRLKEWVQLHFKTNGHRRYKHLTDELNIQTMA
jgi:hypothetical protein